MAPFVQKIEITRTSALDGYRARWYLRDEKGEYVEQGRCDYQTMAIALADMLLSELKSRGRLTREQQSSLGAQIEQYLE